MFTKTRSSTLLFHDSRIDAIDLATLGGVCSVFSSVYRTRAYNENVHVLPTTAVNAFRSGGKPRQYHIKQRHR